jgi:hypothetical protein
MRFGSAPEVRHPGCLNSHSRGPLFSLLRATPRCPGTASLLRGRDGRVPSTATFSAHAVAPRTAVVRPRLLCVFSRPAGVFPAGPVCWPPCLLAFSGRVAPRAQASLLRFAQTAPEPKKEAGAKTKRRGQNEGRSNARRKIRRRARLALPAGPLARSVPHYSTSPFPRHPGAGRRAGGQAKAGKLGGGLNVLRCFQASGENPDDERQVATTRFLERQSRWTCVLPSSAAEKATGWPAVWPRRVGAVVSARESRAEAMTPGYLGAQHGSAEAFRRASSCVGFSSTRRTARLVCLRRGRRYFSSVTIAALAGDSQPVLPP